MSESNTSFLKLKASNAPKLGRNGGSISYVVLADAGHQLLYISIVSNNSGSGCWSTEAVPLEAIERCLPGDRGQALSTKAFRASFQGKSVNNASFLCAALKAEQLIGPADGKPALYQVIGDWTVWKARLLAMEGEPYATPGKASPEIAGQATDVALPVSASPAVSGNDQGTNGASRHKGRKARTGKEGGDAPAA